MKILLISCYQVDSLPGSFYSIFNEYVHMYKLFQKYNYDPYILTDRKNVPIHYLSLKERLTVILDILKDNANGKIIRIRSCIKIIRSLLQKNIKIKKVIYTHKIKSLSNFIKEMNFNSAIIFGGARDDSYIINHKLSKLKIPIIYIERGWLPQKNNLYFDLKGTNFHSSIVQSTFCSNVSKKEINNTNKYLSEIYPKNNESESDIIIVVLQMESDTTTQYFSPFFRSNRNFLKFLSILLKGEKVIFCPHPLEGKISRKKYKDIEQTYFSICPENTKTISLIPNAKVVIGINSTVLIEALAYKKNVIAYGKGIFTGNNVMMEADLNTTKNEILSYRCNQQNIDLFLTQLLRVQFNRKDISKLMYAINNLIS